MTPTQFAALLQGFHCIMMPVAIGGFCYAVKEGSDDANMYRVAIV